MFTSVNNLRTNGVAQYWTVRRFNYLTKSNKHIVQVNGETGKHHIWQDYIYNDNKSYDFVIADDSQLEDMYKISDKLVIHNNGYPINLFKCKDDTIMIYNRNHIIKFK